MGGVSVQPRATGDNIAFMDSIVEWSTNRTLCYPFLVRPYGTYCFYARIVAQVGLDWRIVFLLSLGRCWSLMAVDDCFCCWSVGMRVVWV